MPVTRPTLFTRGDILVSRWGRDQDNIDFYQVIRATQKTLVVRRIESRITEIVGPTRAIVVPVRGSFRSEGLRRLLVHDQDGWCIYLTSWEQARSWDGRELLSTRYP